MAVKIVRNTFDKKLQRLKATGAMNKNDVSKDAKEEIFIQWLASNLRRFRDEEYANHKGIIKKWDDFKEGTKFYTIKRAGRYKQRSSGKYKNRVVGQKVWNTRKASDGSKKKYRENDKLLKASGWLMKSASVSGGIKNVQKIGKTYVQLGSKLKQASYQHKKRPIISISLKDRGRFKRIMIKWLKGEKVR